jgi:hypothetical protein
MCYGLIAYLRICQSGRQSFAGYVGIANFWRWAETLGAFSFAYRPKEGEWDRKQRILAAPA